MSDDIFCKIINGEVPSKVVYEDDIVKCILDVTPQSPGHTLILPKKHYSDILELDEEVCMHINIVAKTLINKMMNNISGITGVVIVINYGAPQTVKHYHMHLIPTYDGECTLSQEEVFDILKRA